MNVDSIYPALPKTTRGCSYKLSVDPSGSILLFTNGTNVFLRSLDKLNECDSYSNHSCLVQTAKYSPSGYYIASADKRGNLYVWDSTFKGAHTLKNEFHPPLASVKEIAWSQDSQHIALGGLGSQRFGHVINASTGSSVGEIMGISREVNCVTFRPCRPLRVAFGSDEGSVSIFNGPPYKFARKTEARNKFVNCAAYSPDGGLIACGGSDGRLLLLDGESGDVREELGNPAHTRSVMGVSWSPTGQNLVSAGADGAVRVWAPGDEAPISSYSFCQENGQCSIQNQQLGCVWAKNFIVTVSLTGYINLFDPTDLNLRKVLKGHQNPVNALCYTNGTLISGGVDGVLVFWRGENPEALDAHANLVEAIAAANKWVVSCGMDDTVVFFRPEGDEIFAKVQLDKQPKGCVTTDLGITVVATVHSLVVFEGTVKINEFDVKYEVTSIDISPDQQEIAVGGSEPELFLYSIDDLSAPKRSVPLPNGARVVSYSKDGKHIAVADMSHTVLCFERNTFTRVDNSYWKHHAAEVTCLSWSLDGHYLASGSVDSHLMVYNVDDCSHVNQLRNAHPRSPVLAICWAEENVLYSGGHDCCIRRWKL